MERTALTLPRVAHDPNVVPVPDDAIVDLTGLVFCSSRGLTAITQAARAAAANGIREDAVDTDPRGSDDGHHLRPDPRDADPSALRRALHRHRSRMYRTALHALGAAYGTHPLAPDLAAQLRIALTGFAATPVDDHGGGSLQAP